MKSKLSCSLRLRPQASNLRWVSSVLVLALACVLWLVVPPAARPGGGEAPSWMHMLVNVPLPAHDEKTDAVKLYAERTVMVQSLDKIKTQVRVAYKILRPGGRELGTVQIPFTAHTKINSIRAWCIPAQGKDYEVRDKDAADVAMPAISGSELVSDVRVKVLHIPASDPGNIIGYEYEQENHPFVLQDIWYFQGSNPAREQHYSLQLPAGWEYKSSWLNHPEVAPAGSGNQWQWIVNSVPGIRDENDMPPWPGIEGQMIVSFVPPGGAGKFFADWRDMGMWYNDLVRGRRDPSPEIAQKTTVLTASLATTLAKMQAIARFLQRDIRYVAIELGIGGYQPHPAADVFAHRYGDCKDKATLMSSMLKGIGIDSYYVVINTERGAITPEMPAHMGGFNHVVLAIKLPGSVTDRSLVAVVEHPKLGRLLFFDPTDQLTPFGSLRGELQANYALLVMPDGGELTALPMLAPTTAGVRRVAKLTLAPTGTLTGDVKEIRYGDQALRQRYALRSASKEADKIKPIETLLARSLPTYRLTDASVSNLEETELPFVFNYSLVAPNYAKNAGGLLLVRPRVIGVQSSDLLETKEPRQYPVVFDGPWQDTDLFEITMPDGYEVDDLPAPVNAEYGFASYHSKAEVNGRVIRYARTFEVKDPSVPLNKVNDLKVLYRIIASDERNTAVLKPAQRP
jgi:Domain of Unknown Function with PDB structure (DUF3857)/Transglutaminase-like superfamily